MMLYPSMIVLFAQNAGIKVPEGKFDEVDPDKYPHFAVFCNAQLGRDMNWDEPGDNAKVIAQISDEEISKVTVRDLLKRGFRIKGMVAPEE